MGQKLFTRLETFGTSNDAKWRISEMDFTGALSKFSVTCEGNHWDQFETPLIGDFNLLNCLAVIIAANNWGVSRDLVREALRNFKNVRRRAEVRGEAAGVTVIDDFAHHPTAVRETLRGLRNRYREGRLIAVFEPRSWSSRLAVFQEDYAQAFSAADYVVIAEVFDSHKALEKGKTLDPRKLISDISQDGKPAFAFSGAAEIIEHLLPQLRSGDVVAIMSNGGFDGIHEKLLDQLTQGSVSQAQSSEA
jgi:UDP-N-acetylmuramate: L-alanyl-gamma-D-glutamyl-meso-diaminopimelate ligase